MANKLRMLPGFYVTIEDTVEVEQKVPNLKDVYTIFGILPEKMKTKDEDGDDEEVYIEPNKPIIISAVDEAVQTLESTNLVLTREIKNIIKLTPENSSVALVRIVKRNGENPDPKSLTDMYEALDFAFESLENFPSREIVLAGLSLDDMVALDPNKVQMKELKTHINGVDKLVKGVFPYGTTSGILVDKKFKFTIKASKSDVSAGEAVDGQHDIYTLKINGETAKIITDDGAKDATVSATTTYDGSAGTKTVNITGLTTEAGDYLELKLSNNKIIFAVKKDAILKLDDETIIKIQAGELEVPEENKTKSEIETSYDVVKLSDNASILRRTLMHNAKITATQNSCYTFASPEPPTSLSQKHIEEYVERCSTLMNKVREQSTVMNSKGKADDLGKFLSVIVGVNSIDGLGGVTGLPQSKLATIANEKCITKKATSAFSVGDLVEVYTHEKLDTIVHKSRVKKITISDTNAIEITLEDKVPDEISAGTNPKYIMNTNNKDFKGTYLARQYSNICRKAGVERSPAGIPWKGECQLKFSEKQLQMLDSKKFCVLQQEHGTSIGTVSRSQLASGVENMFQKIETLAVVYKIIDDSKEILMPYKGKRIDDSTDLALIKTEIEESVFKPAVNEYITPGYHLELKLGQMKNPNGVIEQALFMAFEIVEIKTLQLIRMSAKVLQN